MTIKEKKLELQVISWAARQRRLYKTGVMSKAYQSALESIPEWRWTAVRTCPEEWVRVAEERANARGGILESPNWLKANGFTNLCAAVYRRPDLFSHIPRDGARRTAAEWVRVAEERARNNGGHLENSRWLNSNGLMDLCQISYRHPGLFSHIPIEMRDTHGCLVAIRGGGTRGAVIAQKLGVRHEG
jgi:hypothetical protein